MVLGKSLDLSISSSAGKKRERLLVEIKHCVDMWRHLEQYLAHSRCSVFVLRFSFLTFPGKKKKKSLLKYNPTSQLDAELDGTAVWLE